MKAHGIVSVVVKVLLLQDEPTFLPVLLETLATLLCQVALLGRIA